MRAIPGFVILLLLSYQVVLFPFTAVAEDAVPRLALVASGQGHAESIASLMGVELSRRNDVVLLDRSDINKVLAEHQLQFDGLLTMKDALKTRELLRCDIFAELHDEPAVGGRAEITSLIVFDALTGVRLYDGALDLSRGLDDGAHVAVRAISLGLAKWKGGGTVPVGRTLSIVSARPLGLSESLNHVPGLLELLLERRLVNATDIAVVERKRLEWINKESELTPIRRDLLLASCVLVDLEVSREVPTEKLTVKALLTDGVGKPLGMVSATDSLDRVGNLVDALSRSLLTTLNLSPITESSRSMGFEAERFLGDATRLALRGRMADADVSEKAAIALTEALLSREPHRCELQKLLVRLHHRMTQRVVDPVKLLDWLERDLGYSETWPSDPDAGGFIEGYTDMLHQVIKVLGGRADSDRVKSLRKRFGVWCKKLTDKDPKCFKDIRCVEAWSTTVDGLVADFGAYFNSLPNGLQSSLYTASTNYTSFDRARHLFFVECFAAIEKQQLNRLYEKWGKGSGKGIEALGRMQSYVCAALLVNSYPADFTGSDELIFKDLHRAADVVLEDPSLADAFLELCLARGRRPPDAYRPLPVRVVAGEVRRLSSALDERRIACPLLLEYLDEYDADRAEYPGAYLKRAWAQLQSSLFLQPKGDVCHPRYTDWYVERVREKYHSRYGRMIDQSESKTLDGAIGKAQLRTIQRIFDFETVPGISNIESAELSGKWLYLLCLHSDPRSYELRRVNLNRGKTEVLGEIVTDWVYRARSGNEITIGREAIYVPTEQGLICFAGNSTNVWTLSENSGLPASRVTACQEAGGLLYLGCRGKEEGYVVRCNPRGGAMKILACSGRKARGSGLDDCPPYTIDSIVLDSSGERLFLTAMFLNTDDPWLWSYDLRAGTIKPVHKRPYPSCQLRKCANGQLLMQIAERHPESGGNSVRGYALWDPRTYTGSPLDDFKDVVRPLIGSVDPDRLLIRYATPSFNGRLYTMPGTVSGMALMSGLILVASDVHPAATPQPPATMLKEHVGFGRSWQLIPRSDVGWNAAQLPLLDDEAPFMVRIRDDRILAVTQGGAWIIDPVLPTGAAATKARAELSDVNAGQGKREKVGEKLVVEAPLGSSVSLDKGPTYRVWKDGRLSWNNLQGTHHELIVKYGSRESARTVDVVAGNTTTIEERFGEDRGERRILDLGDGCLMELVRVPPAVSDGLRQGKISFGAGFWIGRYEVTQQQYTAIMGNNPSAWLGVRCPVEQVGRAAAQEFCSRVTKKCRSQLGGLIARLPSEQEWAYAWQAGDTLENGVGNTPDALLRSGWMAENSEGSPHPVGEKMPNRFWLYDMNGNVAEWCEQGKPQGGSWRSSGGSQSDGVGFRVLVTFPDLQLGKTKDDWLYLTHVEPVSAHIGWGTFCRWKQRDAKPGIGGTQFETVMYVHANSSLKYKLGGQYKQFMANYGLWTGANGVCRFVVLADGKERFRSEPIYGTGSTSIIGVTTPVKVDVTGVDILELRTVMAEGKNLSNACGLWGDAKIK